MSASPLLMELIDSLRCLPGVGLKTAQRMAFNLLERQRDAGIKLSKALADSMREIKHCQRCRNFTETALCAICSDIRRDAELLCVVETPADVWAIEHTSTFKGHYFVLMGRLSPLDGIGPAELDLPLLQEHLARGEVKELILATNTTVEGEATAYYIAEMAKALSIHCSRIAHGVPLGGELEYVDSQTLGHAFTGRRII